MTGMYHVWKKINVERIKEYGRNCGGMVSE